MKTVQLLLMILELRGKHNNGLFETVIASIENNSKHMKHHMLCVVGKIKLCVAASFANQNLFLVPPVYAVSNFVSQAMINSRQFQSYRPNTNSQIGRLVLPWSLSFKGRYGKKI